MCRTQWQACVGHTDRQCVDIHLWIHFVEGCCTEIFSPSTDHCNPGTSAPSGSRTGIAPEIVNGLRFTNVYKKTRNRQHFKLFLKCEYCIYTWKYLYMYSTSTVKCTVPGTCTCTCKIWIQWCKTSFQISAKSRFN